MSPELITVKCTSPAGRCKFYWLLSTHQNRSLKHTARVVALSSAVLGRMHVPRSRVPSRQADWHFLRCPHCYLCWMARHPSATIVAYAWCVFVFLVCYRDSLAGVTNMLVSELGQSCERMRCSLTAQKYVAQLLHGSTA